MFTGIPFLSSDVIATLCDFFYGGDAEIHYRCEDTENDGARHNEIHFEYLAAVDDQVPKTCRRYEVFAHDRSDPGKPDVDFEHIE